MIVSIDPNENLCLDRHDMITLRGVLENHITELINKRDSLDCEIGYKETILFTLKEQMNDANH